MSTLLRAEIEMLAAKLKGGLLAKPIFASRGSLFDELRSYFIGLAKNLSEGRYAIVILRSRGGLTLYNMITPHIREEITGVENRFVNSDFLLPWLSDNGKPEGTIAIADDVMITGGTVREYIKSLRNEYGLDNAMTVAPFVARRPSTDVPLIKVNGNGERMFVVNGKPEDDVAWAYDNFFLSEEQARTCSRRLMKACYASGVPRVAASPIFIFPIDKLNKADNLSWQNYFEQKLSDWTVTPIDIDTLADETGVEGFYLHTPAHSTRQACLLKRPPAGVELFSLLRIYINATTQKVTLVPFIAFETFYANTDLLIELPDAITYRLRYSHIRDERVKYKLAHELLRYVACRKLGLGFLGIIGIEQDYCHYRSLLSPLHKEIPLPEELKSDPDESIDLDLAWDFIRRNKTRYNKQGRSIKNTRNDVIISGDEINGDDTFAQLLAGKLNIIDHCTQYNLNSNSTLDPMYICLWRVFRGMSRVTSAVRDKQRQHKLDVDYFYRGFQLSSLLFVFRRHKWLASRGNSQSVLRNVTLQQLYSALLKLGETGIAVLQSSCFKYNDKYVVGMAMRHGEDSKNNGTCGSDSMFGISWLGSSISDAGIGETIAEKTPLYDIVREYVTRHQYDFPLPPNEIMTEFNGEHDGIRFVSDSPCPQGTILSWDEMQEKAGKCQRTEFFFDLASLAYAFTLQEDFPDFMKYTMSQSPEIYNRYSQYLPKGSEKNVGTSDFEMLLNR